MPNIENGPIDFTIRRYESTLLNQLTLNAIQYQGIDTAGSSPGAENASPADRLVRKLAPRRNTVELLEPHVLLQTLHLIIICAYLRLVFIFVVVVVATVT